MIAFFIYKLQSFAQQTLWCLLILFGINSFSQAQSLDINSLSLTGCYALGYCLNIVANENVNATVELNLDEQAGYQDGGTDVKLNANITKGNNCIKWDGFDARGAMLKNEKSIELTINIGASSYRNKVMLYTICPPVAVNDNLSTDKNKPLIVTSAKLGLNDSFLEGAVIYNTLLNQITEKGGRITMDSVGRFTYTPPDNFVGNDEFTYTICYFKYRQLCASAKVLVAVSGQGFDLSKAIDDYYKSKNDQNFTGNVLQNDLNGSICKVTTTTINSSQGVVVSFNPDGSFNYSPQPNFVGVDSFPYKICNVVQADLCDEGMVYIQLFVQNDIEIPTAFSPNGDGKNDILFIKNIEQYEDNEVSIFNRWGQLIFAAKKYDNVKVFWDGIGAMKPLLSRQLQDNIYYYTIKLSNDLEVKTGSIVLVK